MIQKKNISFKKIISVLLGIILSAITIGATHAVQGLILDDWSGLHPYYRLYYIVNYILLGFFLGIIILTIIHFSRRKMIRNIKDFFIYGLILGSIGLSNLVHPWLGYDYIDSAFFLVITIIAFFKAQRG